MDTKTANKAAKMIKRYPFIWIRDSRTGRWVFAYTSAHHSENDKIIIYEYSGSCNDRYSSRLYDRIYEIDCNEYLCNMKNRSFKRIFDTDYALNIAEHYNNQKEYEYFYLNDIPYRVLEYEEKRCLENPYVEYTPIKVKSLNLVMDCVETFEITTLKQQNFKFTDKTNDIIIDMIRMQHLNS